MTLSFHLRARCSYKFGWTREDHEQFLADCDFAQPAGFASIEIPARGDFSSAFQSAVTAGESYRRLIFRVAGDLSGMLESLRGREAFEAAEALNGRLIVHFRMPDDDDCRSAGVRAAQEFLGSLRRQGSAHGMPLIEIEGDSTSAAYLAIKWADCLWRTTHRTQRVFADALPILHLGKHVGLCLRMIAAPATKEATDVAASAISSPEELMIASDQEFASSILEYRDAGISQFLISDVDGTDAPRHFARHVLPLIQASECGPQAA